MLYHVCRYRDSRNVRANSRNFHDDDDLDAASGGDLKFLIELLPLTNV